jgi:hypothetical protein
MTLRFATAQGVDRTVQSAGCGRIADTLRSVPIDSLLCAAEIFATMAYSIIFLESSEGGGPLLALRGGNSAAAATR